MMSERRTARPGGHDAQVWPVDTNSWLGRLPDSPAAQPTSGAVRFWRGPLLARSASGAVRFWRGPLLARSASGAVRFWRDSPHLTAGFPSFR